jgi:DNA polymerase-3 subunit delta
MKFREFCQSIQHPEAVYVLVNKQDYLRGRVLEICRQQVPEEARAFDWATFDLEEDDPADLLGVARTIPWMTPRRWIFVRNAHLGEQELADYLADPSDRTVVVLETPQKVRKWNKLPAIELGSDGRPAVWLVRRARQEGYEMGSETAEMLVNLVGEDLQTLESELEKLLLWHLEDRRIELDSVLRLVSDVREHDVFELITAVAARRRDEALRLLGRLFAAGMAPQQILALLLWSFRRLLVARERLERREPFLSIVKDLKIWSYRQRERQIRSYPKEFLAGVLLKMRETDRLCKTTGLDPKLYLERLVIDTCRTTSV